jgi:NADH-quinone oxidoreductase subunit N
MSDLLLVAPIALCAATGVLVMAVDLLAGRAPRGFLAYVASAGMAAAGATAYLAWRGTPSFEAPWLQGILYPDAYAAFFAALVLGSGVAAALLSVHHLPEQRADGGEHYALLAFSVTGALVFVAANDLVTLFLGLEIMSLAVYVMAAGRRRSPFAIEAGLKYFVLGGLASAFLLFGIAFLYGATGKLDLQGVAGALAGGGNAVLPQVAALLLLVALAFKVAAVPFHMWTPDVYEGAPTPTVAFMAGAVKAAGFAVLARVLLTAYQAPSFRTLPVSVPDALLALSVLTMVVGNVLGVVQTSVKRILAYSSIAHAGYILLGVYATRAAPGAPGAAALNDAVPFYLLTYTAATVGSFGVVSLLGAGGEEDMSLDHVSGLARRHPVLAAILLVCLLSLAGIPPLAGFIGKFWLFKQVLAADPAGNLPWVIVAVLSSLLALYYYLRIVLHVYFREPARERPPAIRSAPAWIASGTAALVVAWVGLFPAPFTAASTAVADVAVVRAAPAVLVPAPAPAPTSPVAPAAPAATRRAFGAPSDRGVQGVPGLQGERPVPPGRRDFPRVLPPSRRVVPRP